jgi:undecaprenyl diphosphate synthase
MSSIQDNNIPQPQSGSNGPPQHIAVIMDGNGRWATARGMPRIQGHRKGAESVRQIIRDCGSLGVRYLTLFAFSSENWQRPPREVKLLMELFISVLEKDIDELVKNGVRLRILGDIERFGSRIVKLIKKAELRTAGNERMQLNIAANYGGRWDIAQACRQLAERALRGEIDAGDIDEQAIDACLVTAGIPEPDLFIRSGGERRISNFLIWQLSYTELYFCDVLWPDFSTPELNQAIDWYRDRERRFGKTSEQVGNKAGHA